MLVPKITYCEECPSVLPLINAIDCKLHSLSLSAYNNIAYSLNLNINKSDALYLLNYKRILLYKSVDPGYACQFSVEQIASKVRLLTTGGKTSDCSCNEILPPPCTAHRYLLDVRDCNDCVNIHYTDVINNATELSVGYYYYYAPTNENAYIREYVGCVSIPAETHLLDINKRTSCEASCPPSTTTSTTQEPTTTSSSSSSTSTTSSTSSSSTSSTSSTTSSTSSTTSSTSSTTSSSSTTSTTSSTTTPTPLMAGCVGCDSVVPMYYVGVHEYCVNLDPAGGVAVFQLAAGLNCDKFEILHNNVKKATSGMTVANAGPFDNLYGPSNMPRPVDELDVNQFIGTASHIAGGSIPTRNSAFAAENPSLSYITTGIGYEQLIWWNYTPTDYSLSPNIIIRVTTGHSSDYNIQRRCPTYVGPSTTTTTSTTPSTCVSYLYSVTAANLTASDDNTVYVRVTGCTGVTYTIKASTSNSGSSICATSGTPFQYILVGGVETAVAVQPSINGVCP